MRESNFREYFNAQGCYNQKSNLQLNAALNSLTIWSHPAWTLSDQSEDLIHVAAVSQLVKHHRTNQAIRQSSVADIIYGVRGFIPDSRLAQYGDYRYDNHTENMFITTKNCDSLASKSMSESSFIGNSDKLESVSENLKAEEFHFHSTVNCIMNDLDKDMQKLKIEENMDEWLNMLNTVLNDTKWLAIKREIELDEWTKKLLNTCIQFVSAARTNKDLLRLMETDVPFIINFQQLHKELVSREELLSIKQPPLSQDEYLNSVQEGRLWIKLSTPAVRRNWTTEERSTMFANLPPAIGDAFGWSSNVVGITNFLKREPALTTVPKESSFYETEDMESSVTENLLGSLMEFIDKFDTQTNSTLGEIAEDFPTSRIKNSFPQAHGKWNEDLFPHRMNLNQRDKKMETKPSDVEKTVNQSHEISSTDVKEVYLKSNARKDSKISSSPLNMMMPALPMSATMRALASVVPCVPPSESGAYLEIQHQNFRQGASQARSWVRLPPLKDQLPYLIRHPPPTYSLFRNHQFLKNINGNWRDTLQPANAATFPDVTHQLKTKRLTVSSSKASLTESEDSIHAETSSSRNNIAQLNNSERRNAAYTMNISRMQNRHPAMPFRMQASCSSSRQAYIKAGFNPRHARNSKRNKSENCLNSGKFGRSSSNAGSANFQPQVSRRESATNGKGSQIKTVMQTHKAIEALRKNMKKEDYTRAVKRCMTQQTKMKTRMMQNEMFEISTRKKRSNETIKLVKSKESLLNSTPYPQNRFSKENHQAWKDPRFLNVMKMEPDEVNFEFQQEWPSLPNTETRNNAWSNEGQKILWSEHFKNGFGLMQATYNSPLKTLDTSLENKTSQKWRSSTPIENLQINYSNEAILSVREQECEWPIPSTSSKLSNTKNQASTSSRTHRRKKKMKCKKEYSHYIADQMKGNVDSDSSTDVDAKNKRYSRKKGFDANKSVSTSIPFEPLINSENDSSITWSKLTSNSKDETTSSNDHAEALNDSRETPYADPNNSFAELFKKELCKSRDGNPELSLNTTKSSESLNEESNYFADEETTLSLNVSSDDELKIKQNNSSLDLNYTSPGREAVNIVNRLFQNPTFLNRNSRYEDKWGIGKEYNTILPSCHSRKINGWTHFRTAIQTILKNVLQSVQDKEKL